MSRPRANPAQWGFSAPVELPAQKVRKCRACARRMPHAGPTCLGCMARSTARYLELTGNAAAREGLIESWRAAGFLPGIAPRDPLLDHEFWASCWVDMEIRHAAAPSGDDTLGDLMSRLHRGKRQTGRRTLVYGVHGCGKSTLGAGAPAPVFIPTEDGIADLDVVSFGDEANPTLKSFDEVVGAINALFTEEHDRKTVVIDSLTALEPLIWSKICKAENVANIEQIDYMRGYTFALDLWRMVLAGLDALRLKRGMHVVMIAHSQVIRHDDPLAESFDRYVPALHKKAWPLICQWCDEVLFAHLKPPTVKTDDLGFDKSRGRALQRGGSQRGLACTRSPAHEGKNRLGMPDLIPLSWAAYAAYIDGTAQRADANPDPAEASADATTASESN